MLNAMMHTPLLVPAILEHAVRQYPEQEIVCYGGDTPYRYTYREFSERVLRLAGALQGLGVGKGDRVATLAWNTHEHLELYYAIAMVGGICHTINPRYSIEQMRYVVDHADSRVLFYDVSLLAVATEIRSGSPGIRVVVAIGGEAVEENGLAYEQLLASDEVLVEIPLLNEDDPCGLCYTSGTTGSPKGVCYTHRSTVLHAMSCLSREVLGLWSGDVVLAVVPMFHVNAWGFPYSALMAGASLVLPGADLSASTLYQIMEDESVGFSAGVPTIWQDLIEYLDRNKKTFSTVRKVLVGGAAAPAKMFEDFARHGASLIHGWGMTETTIGAVGNVPADLEYLPEEEKTRLKTKQGRAPFGFEMKIVDEHGQDCVQDGVASGELLVRGPWVVANYLGAESEEALQDGWFATGDIATLDPRGYMEIVDRKKDVIKSGGEWISSIALENAVIKHPSVARAAVIGKPDHRWSERPLMIVVPADSCQPSVEELREFLMELFPRWWVPEDIVFDNQLPLGPTGKVLKTQLRDKYLH